MPHGHEPANSAAATPTVLILGAGINGAALARELALSDVSVVVVDADDIACGATAWSTRLIHGGLRYLEYGEVRLVRESLVERDRLLRAAPHLVRRLPFYVPLQGRLGGLWSAAARLVGLERLARRWRGKRGRGSWALRIGLTLYDALAMGSKWPRHAIVRAGGRDRPRVDAARFPLAATYADGQALYPERLALEFLLDARAIASERGRGCDVYPRHRCRLHADGRVEISRSDDTDEVSLEFRPAAIVNATGPWVDRVCAELLPSSAGCDQRLMGGTKGSHLVIRSPDLRRGLAESGIYAEADDGRPVFVLPFGDALVLVGTTDLPFAGDPALARADEQEIDYLLAAVGRLFPDIRVARDDVQQHYSGVRPLPWVDPSTNPPGGITRRHQLVRHVGCPLPTWSIVGGKLTTCRSLAESTAAAVLATLGRPVRDQSRGRALPGAWPTGGRDEAISHVTVAAAAVGVPDSLRHRVAVKLIDVFGARAALVWRRARSADLLPGVDMPPAAVGFCVAEEWATSIEDVVERRLMLIFDPGLSLDTVKAIAAELVDVGQLSAEECETAVATFVARLRDHFGRTVEHAV